MNDMNILLAQAKAAKAQLADQSIVQEGGNFEYEIPEAGVTPARFIGYVETGLRKQRAFQGKEKADCHEARLYFELNGKKHRKEIEVNGEKKTITNIIAVKVAIKQSDKASFTKLFRKMVYGRPGIDHMIDMLGEPFLITIVHNEAEAKEGKKPVTYANMKDSDGNWLIGAPELSQMNADGDVETVKVPVPEVTATMKMLLWDAPSKEQWDSIFIDGTRTVKNADGTEREVSKNWLQEDILENALNLEGSLLQGVIGGLGDLDLNVDAPVDTPAETPAEAVKEPEAPTTPEEAPKAAPAPSKAPDDVLDALDL